MNVILKLPERLYVPGIHAIPAVIVPEGSTTFMLKATKLDWPVEPNLIEGVIQYSEDDGETWRFLCSWKDDGNHDMPHSFVEFHLGQEYGIPRVSKDTWQIRGLFNNKKSLKTVLTFEVS